MPTIETSRGLYYFTDHRQNDNPYPPVLLIHGAGGTHLDWSPHIRKLPEANAIALDLNGHGKSDGDGHNTIQDYAQDIMAVIDALHLEPVIICGQSMGGAIAQHLALYYPEYIAGMILITTGAKLQVHPDIIGKILTNYEQVVQLLITWYWSDDIDEQTRQLSYNQLMRISPQIVYGDYQACNDFDLREQLTQIHTPTLVVGATEDKMTPVKYSQYLAKNLPNAELVIIKETGHMAHLEKPLKVREAMQNWLVRLYDREA